MSFTEEAWAAAIGVRRAIGELPFVRGLADGSLSRDRFVYYMAQDALYLNQYSRVLAHLATSAPTSAEIEFWLTSATTAITVERGLHGQWVGDLDAATPSPTCRGYTGYLATLALTAPYPVLAAGVLPCFWIYADVGDHLLADAGDLANHPYGEWIGLYADEAFAHSVRTVRGLVDGAAEEAGPSTRQAMLDAYVTASRYEWMFWDAAWRCEAWPV